MTRDHDAELVAFLKSKRWFGDKTREIRGARLRERIALPFPNASRDFAVARADVETDAGVSTYQLLLDRNANTFGDALEQPELRRGLIDAFARGMAFEQGGARWIIESESRKPFIAPPAVDISLSRAEQSNSSVLVDGAAILKLFRKLEPGVHPDVEVTRFLTIDRQFLHVPVLLGTIRFEDAEGTTVAGMLQEMVPGATDGWAYALQRTQAFFAGKDTALPFQEEAAQLGEVTRALHESLASGDPGSAFASTRASGDDVAEWVAATERMSTRALASLRKTKAMESKHSDAARRVAGSGARFAELLEQWKGELAHDAGLKTRTHGDYHLGQVLRSAADRFLVIDFEGEPARPLRERRGLQSPLRDVAGMLRSFAYLAAVAARDAKMSDARDVRWEQETRRAFLRGYFADVEGSALLPRDRQNAERLIALFEAEKAFYELQYELDHRPDWVWIPLRGITALIS